MFAGTARGSVTPACAASPGSAQMMVDGAAGSGRGGGGGVADEDDGGGVFVGVPTVTNPNLYSEVTAFLERFGGSGGGGGNGDGPGGGGSAAAKSNATPSPPSNFAHTAVLAVEAAGRFSPAQEIQQQFAHNLTNAPQKGLLATPATAPPPPPSFSGLGQKSPPKQAAALHIAHPNPVYPPQATAAVISYAPHLQVPQPFAHAPGLVQPPYMVMTRPKMARTPETSTVPAQSLFITPAASHRPVSVLDDNPRWNGDEELARAKRHLDFLHAKKGVYESETRLAVLKEAAVFINAQVRTEERKLERDKQAMTRLDDSAPFQELTRSQVAERSGQHPAPHALDSEQDDVARRWRPVLDELKPYDPVVDVDVMVFLRRFQGLCVHNGVPYSCWSRLLSSVLPRELSDAVFRDWETGNPIDPSNFLAMKRSVVSNANNHEGDLATVYRWKLENHKWDPAKGLTQYLSDTLEFYKLWSTSAGYPAKVRNGDTLRRDFLVGPLLRQLPSALLDGLGLRPEILTFEELKPLLTAAYSRHLKLRTPGVAPPPGSEYDEWYRSQHEHERDAKKEESPLKNRDGGRRWEDDRAKAEDGGRARTPPEKVEEPKRPRTPVSQVECKFDPCRRRKCPFKHRPDHNRDLRGSLSQTLKAPDPWTVKKEDTDRRDSRRISSSGVPAAGYSSSSKSRSEVECRQYPCLVEDCRELHTRGQKDGTTADRLIKREHSQDRSSRSHKRSAGTREDDDDHEKDLYWGGEVYRAPASSVGGGASSARHDDNRRDDAKWAAAVSSSYHRRECPEENCDRRGCLYDHPKRQRR